MRDTVCEKVCAGSYTIIIFIKAKGTTYSFARVMHTFTTVLGVANPNYVKKNTFLLRMKVVLKTRNEVGQHS